MPFALSPDNAVAYLFDHGLISQAAARTASATPLGGGVSNIVIRVSTSGDTDGALVIKQSLPQLRVAQDWFADRRRIHREWASIQYLANVLPPGAIPRVIYADEQDYLYVMTAAPEDGVNWKEALLSGQIDAAVAGEVGRLLGEIHRATRIDHGQIPELLQPFANQDCFVQLRIDPYHRATAAIHADLADLIEGEAQRMLNRHLVMVHGDYSPKNVIVAGVGESAHVFLLDFEVVHLGNPVFDLAFMLNHFTLKAIYQPALAERYCAAARSFWSEYVDCVGTTMGDWDALGRDTVRQMGVLLLARVDGKSPAEYITEIVRQQRARTLARSILTGEVDTLAEVHAQLSDGI
jgi:5-methylthioribose kinase